MHSDEMTGHGFRAMACTCLNELGWHPDVIELQMAHAERNKVRAAYNRAERLADRRKMMQAWADYLDRLRSDSRKAFPTEILLSGQLKHTVEVLRRTKARAGGATQFKLTFSPTNEELKRHRTDLNVDEEHRTAIRDPAESDHH